MKLYFQLKNGKEWVVHSLTLVKKIIDIQLHRTVLVINLMGVNNLDIESENCHYVI